MINQPLTSGDHSKIVIFILLFLPTVFIGVGVIPAIFLAFGIFMMKKNEDFNYLETAVDIYWGYFSLVLLFCGGLAIYFGISHLMVGYADSDDLSGFYFFLLATLIALLYLVFILKLFFNPLSQHKNWVEINGIFSTKPKSERDSGIKSEVDIIKGEKLKQYSVADELSKWAKLKEDGHISEEEFNDARIKLLKRN